MDVDTDMETVFKCFYRFWFSLLDPRHNGAYNINKVVDSIEKNINACNELMQNLYKHGLIRILPGKYKHII